MSKVDTGAYGGGRQRPNLNPDMLRDADSAVLTIDDAQTGITTSDGRTAAVLEFREFPGYAFWLTAGGVKALVKQLGDDDEEWVGAKIPIVRVRVNNPSTGRKVIKYHVADPDDWNDIAAEAKKQTRARSKAEKEAATKNKGRGSKK